MCIVCGGIGPDTAPNTVFQFCFRTVINALIFSRMRSSSSSSLLSPIFFFIIIQTRRLHRLSARHIMRYFIIFFPLSSFSFASNPFYFLAAPVCPSKNINNFGDVRDDGRAKTRGRQVTTPNFVIFFCDYFLI